MRERWFPGAARRYWWADLGMWREIWDAITEPMVLATVTPIRAELNGGRAERPKRGGWGDPGGPGRCPRCELFLEPRDQWVWDVRERRGSFAVATLTLCTDCTREVLVAWLPGWQLHE